MRFPVVCGLAMGAGMAGLGLFAASEDSYYGDGTTHWEHATKDGGTEVLLALFVIPSAIALAFIVLGLRRRPPTAMWGIPGFAIYGLAVFYAYAVLAGGH
jgi:hypothetical protein